MQAMTTKDQRMMFGLYVRALRASGRMGVLASVLAPLQAATEPLVVPNGSFELPATPFVSLLIDGWQRTPKPAWYVEDGGFQWNQLTGIFVNTAPGAADHLESLDGRQAAWLFAVPEAGLFQQIRNAAGTAPAVYEAGRSYRITFDAVGGGGNMLEGVTLEVGLIRWDSVSNRVWVASTVVTNSPALFDPRTYLRTFSLTTPVLAPADPAVGTVIGVQVVSTVSAASQGGYWDVDRVRVEALTPTQPELTHVLEAGQLRLGWRYESGVRYRVRRSGDLRGWAVVGEPVLGTGEAVSVRVPVGAGVDEFFSLTTETVE
jgi:hypothetical protein